MTQSSSAAFVHMAPASQQSPAYGLHQRKTDPVPAAGPPGGPALPKTHTASVAGSTLAEPWRVLAAAGLLAAALVAGSRGERRARRKGTANIARAGLGRGGGHPAIWDLRLFSPA
ncbi:unnamed protein product [Polarella glacialis]|uniref:Uncharacterized protein n=1 Tax=Polarella glacialis TaxID=89957 RepID=A0A813E1Q3_POLGL|nr:unnamed protein product [Polarella glacialis]